MEILTNHINQSEIGYLENELAELDVPVELFKLNADGSVSFVIDEGSALQPQIDWATSLAANMQSLTVNVKNEAGEAITEIPDDGTTKAIITCDELPTEFGYAISTNDYTEVIKNDTVDTDGTVELTSNKVGKHQIMVFDPADVSRVTYVQLSVVSGG